MPYGNFSTFENREVWSEMFHCIEMLVVASPSLHRANISFRPNVVVAMFTQAEFYAFILSRNITRGRTRAFPKHVQASGPAVLASCAWSS